MSCQATKMYVRQLVTSVESPEAIVARAKWDEKLQEFMVADRVDSAQLYNIAAFIINEVRNGHG